MWHHCKSSHWTKYVPEKKVPQVPPRLFRLWGCRGTKRKTMNEKPEWEERIITLIGFFPTIFGILVQLNRCLNSSHTIHRSFSYGFLWRNVRNLQSVTHRIKSETKGQEESLSYMSWGHVERFNISGFSIRWKFVCRQCEKRLIWRSWKGVTQQWNKLDGVVTLSTLIQHLFNICIVFGTHFKHH